MIKVSNYRVLVFIVALVCLPGAAAASGIKIDFSGSFTELCPDGGDVDSCHGDEFASLAGAAFSGAILVPGDLGPDLEPGDPDRGVYRVDPGAGVFRFDTLGIQYDLSGTLPFHVIVQDCNFNPACEFKQNFVWIDLWDGSSSIEYTLYLNGAPGELGPESEALPPIERLQLMANIGGNFGIQSLDPSTGLAFIATELRMPFDPSNTSTQITIAAVPVPAVSLLPFLATLVLGFRRAASASE